MDCCPKVEPPELFKKLIDKDTKLNGKKLLINEKYIVSQISSEHMFPLIKQETENFPGYEWKTRPVPVQAKTGEYWWCETYVVFHSDMKRWTGEVFLYSQLESPDGLSTRPAGAVKRLEGLTNLETIDG